jgi:protein-S-isoprenylcysteine O-methyltransferase Ste14
MFLTPFSYDRLSTLCAFLARWILISLAWCVLHYAPLCLAYLPESRLTQFLINYLSGPMYRPWALWFVDYYWLAFTLAGPLYFYDQRGRFLLNNDKYQALLAFLLQGFLRPWGLKIVWSPLVRLGLLTVLLKLFFIPYIVTWGIENLINLWHAVHPDQWNFRNVNHLLIESCLFIDVAMFGFGYLVESKRLNSEIRSVDPSWFGWLVCLWCYPPFNGFSFLPFDKAVLPIQLETTESVRLFFNGCESALWMVFAWASLSLGFKASNLTVRGVVCRGPYRWVRHPAYAAKISVWWIQGVIFGEFTLGILLAFTLVYWLRAWTEERNMAFDPEYADYCRKVWSRFIPGVF